MIHYVPDPEPLDDHYGLKVGEALRIDPFNKGYLQTFTVYYTGSYPPPHFVTDGWGVDPQLCGTDIYGMEDSDGKRFWVGKPAADNAKERALAAFLRYNRD